MSSGGVDDDYFNPILAVLWLCFLLVYLAPFAFWYLIFPSWRRTIRKNLEGEIYG